MFWWGLFVGAFIGWVLCSLWTPEPPDCGSCKYTKAIFVPPLINNGIDISFKAEVNKYLDKQKLRRNDEEKDNQGAV